MARGNRQRVPQPPQPAEERLARRCRFRMAGGDWALPPDAIDDRDKFHRLTRRPLPLEAMASTRGDTAYGLATTVTFCEGEPIKATLARDGRCAMSHSLERRITADDKPDPTGREYLTVPQLAAVLDVSPPTVTKALTDANLELYRPGGTYGQRRISLLTVERYILRCNFSPERTEEMLARARILAAQ